MYCGFCTLISRDGMGFVFLRVRNSMIKNNQLRTLIRRSFMFLAIYFLIINM